MKLFSAFVGGRRRCLLCDRGKAVRDRHFCQDCLNRLQSLAKRRQSVKWDRFKAELSGAPKPDLDPDLRASHGNERLVEEIARSLDHSNPSVRRQAVRDLEILNNPLAVRPLGELVVKEHSKDALRALAEIGDLSAAEYMYRALNADDYWWLPRQEKMGDGDKISDPSWREITVYPYEEEMIGRLRSLGGQELVMRTFVRLVEDPDSRRRDAAADVLLEFARRGGARGDLDKDQVSRELLIGAATDLLRGSATEKAKGSQILSQLGHGK